MENSQFQFQLVAGFIPLINNRNIIALEVMDEFKVNGLRLFVLSVVIWTWNTWATRPLPVVSPVAKQQIVFVEEEKKETERIRFNDCYKVGRKLGTGAFSVAYEAFSRADPSMRVAVKVTKKKNISPDIERTIRSEIEIMKYLEHPNIVKYICHFEEENYWYVVLELLEGGELFDRIVKKSRYDEKEARDLVNILLGAVKYIHDRDIVHRDLKLENLLLQNQDDNAAVKVADFGFAKVSPNPNLLTQCGSPLYVAPEIISHQPYGKAADMWAIGVITYILLGGYPPFQDDGKQSILFANIKAGKYQFDEEYWAHISKEAKDLISKLLTIDPNNRINVENALAHSWLDRSSEDLAAVSLDINLKQLKRFRAKRKFRAAVAAVIAISKLSGMVTNKQNSPMPTNMCSRSEFMRTPRPFDSDDESLSMSVSGDLPSEIISVTAPVSSRPRTYSDGSMAPWWN